MIDFTIAIMSLYPTAEWELHGDLYEGLIWKSADVQKPTEAELTTEYFRVKAEAEAAAQAKIDARQSALNKLMALGLTEEEALALGVK